MTEMTCITCPIGCRITVDESNGFAVTGNACRKGEAYGKNELQNPVRVLTTTVKIDGANHRRCPVKTRGAIPKGLLFGAMKEIQKARLTSPVACGQVVTENLLGTGIDVVATRDM